MLKTRVKKFITVKEDEKQPKLQFKPVMKTVLAFIFGFLLMNPFVTGTVSPFSISLIASLSSMQCIAATAGTVIGSFVFFDATDTVKYLAVALFCCMINEICARYFGSELMKITPYINSFLSMLIISGAIMFATGFELETFITIIYESMLCCIGTYIFVQGNLLVFGEKDFSRFTTKEFMITLLSAGFLLMPFYKYTVLNFSFVGVIFSFVHPSARQTEKRKRRNPCRRLRRNMCRAQRSDFFPQCRLCAVGTFMRRAFTQKQIFCRSRLCRLCCRLCAD